MNTPGRFKTALVINMMKKEETRLGVGSVILCMVNIIVLQSFFRGMRSLA